MSPMWVTRQGVFRPILSTSGESRRGDNTAMRNNLRKLRLERKLGQEELARLMGTTRSQYIKLEKGERRLSDVWIARAASALGVDAGALVTNSDGVPLVGYVGAGGQAIMYTDFDNQTELVARPPDAGQKTVAAIVRGDSMSGIAEDGDLIYWEDEPSPPTEAMIGKLCVVGTADGRILVKRLLKGSRPGLWHLISTNHAPIEDCEVAWASRVTWVKPQ